jgi:hypothetical protein
MSRDPAELATVSFVILPRQPGPGTVRSMSTAPQLHAGVRQDMLVADPGSGDPRRLTVYTGTVWLAPPPQISGSGGGIRLMSSPGIDAMDPARPLPLFLPDSLPYRQGVEAVVTAVGAPLGWVDQVGTDARLLYPLVGQLNPDPRGGEVAWAAIEVRGRGRLHALTYTVWVTVPPEAVR